tara:strand:- start:11841 stop:13469 length:1629 start_codon:yes stop_codon:yes gene_type:complete
MPLKRDLGQHSLLFAGLSSIIGSGWLFGAQFAASLAGPAATLAWLLGTLIVLVIAAVAAELGTMFPVSGGTARYSHATHGPLVGFIAASSNWIWLAIAIPIEALASVQYMSSWGFEWTQNLYSGDELTPPGLVWAGLLVMVYFLLNYWGVQLFARVNNLITIFKIVVPALTALGLMLAAFDVGNLTGTNGGFMPYGASGVLTAVATSGIILSFNGFQSPLNLAGEAKNPGKSIPYAILGSVVISAIVYMLLQIAYLGAIDADTVAKGWNTISFSSPFAQLALLLNLHWLAFLLYADAFVSPSGSGITNMATSSRILYGMERNGVAPRILGKIDARYGVPRPAMWFNLGVSFLFLYYFRGWGQLAGVLSVAVIVSYLMIPISALALRRAAAHLHRPFHLRGMTILAPVAFVASAEMLYWARWPLTGHVLLVLSAPLPIYLWYRRHVSWQELLPELKSAMWIASFLPVMALVSFCGSKEFGGIGWLPYGWDMILVGILGLAFCYWGVSSAYDEPAVDELIMPEPPEFSDQPVAEAAAVPQPATI